MFVIVTEAVQSAPTLALRELEAIASIWTNSGQQALPPSPKRYEARICPRLGDHFAYVVNVLRSSLLCLDVDSAVW